MNIYIYKYMFQIENSLTVSIVLYLFLISLVIYLKPKLIFTEDGDIKKFGTGQKKTIYPLWLIVIITSVISFYIILIFKLINQNCE